MATQSTDVTYSEVDLDDEQQIPFLHEGAETNSSPEKRPTVCYAISWRSTAVTWTLLCLSIIFFVSGERDRSLEAKCIHKMNGWCKSWRCFLSNCFSGG